MASGLPRAASSTAIGSLESPRATLDRYAATAAADNVRAPSLTPRNDFPRAGLDG